MTRKRFIRLLMAEGYQRNRAHEIAWATQRSGVPYAKAYFIRHYPLAKALCNALDPFIKAIEKAKEVLGESFTRMVEKFSVAGGWRHENSGD